MFGFIFSLILTNTINSDVITLSLSNEDAKATGAIINIWPPHHDYYKIDMCNDKTIEIELDPNEPGTYVFTAQSYDENGRFSEESEDVFYEVHVVSKNYTNGTVNDQAGSGGCFVRTIIGQ